MHMVVCIKQVPDSAQIRVHPPLWLQSFSRPGMVLAPTSQARGLTNPRTSRCCATRDAPYPGALNDLIQAAPPGGAGLEPREPGGRQRGPMSFVHLVSILTSHQRNETMFTSAIVTTALIAAGVGAVAAVIAVVIAVASAVAVIGAVVVLL